MFSLTLALMLLLTLVAACSDGDDPEPTEDTTAAQNTESVTASPTATTSPTATEPAATPSPTPSSTTAPSPTPTAPVIADGGAELRINDQPVTLMIRGDDVGRTLYAQTAEGLWRTSDGGATWNEAGEALEGRVIVALNEPNVIYAGDRGDCGRGISFADFMRSTDAGRSWEVIDANQDIEPLLAYEERRAAYLYGTNCGLIVSDDGGTSWESVVDLAGEEIWNVATDRTEPLEHLAVVATTEGGTGRLFLMQVEDPLKPDLNGAVAQFFGRAAVDWRDGRLILATVNGVGVSDDLGATWTWSRSGLEDATFSIDPLTEEIPAAELDPFRELTIARIDPENLDRMWVGGTLGAFVSTDTGQTWTRLGGGDAVDSIVVSRLTDRVFVSAEGATRIWSLDGN